jgi:hypothetical protein
LAARRESKQKLKAKNYEEIAVFVAAALRLRYFWVYMRPVFAWDGMGVSCALAASLPYCRERLVLARARIGGTPFFISAGAASSGSSICRAHFTTSRRLDHSQPARVAGAILCDTA